MYQIKVTDNTAVPENINELLSQVYLNEELAHKTKEYITDNGIPCVVKELASLTR